MALDGGEILRQVDRKLNPESYEMYRKLINIEPDGRKKEFVLFTAKKGRDKMVALFLDPPSDKGRATLRLGDNMWLYIPNVGKPIRITSLQSVVGTGLPTFGMNSHMLSPRRSVERPLSDAGSRNSARTLSRPFFTEYSTNSFLAPLGSTLMSLRYIS